MHFLNRLRSMALGLAVWLTATGSALPATNSFGFAGVEIFPVDSFVSHLQAADFDGDGLKDLVLVNNLRSKLTLLYNQTGHTNKPAAVAGVKRNLNELPPDARFRLDSIPSEKRITSLVTADFNGDGRPDLAYYGDPRELIVLYNQGSNSWSAPKRWPLDDGQLSMNALASGELTGDGRKDLLLLAEDHLWLLPQQPTGGLGEPVKIPLGTLASLVHVADVNQDGRNDLVLVQWDSPTPIRLRLQEAGGQLGPEIYFKLPQIRALCLEPLELGGSPRLVSIALSSGRAGIGSFAQRASEPLVGALREGQFSVVPLARTARAARGLAWADVNGDQLPDLLTAEPESGQLTLALGQPDGALAAPRSFPSLMGISEIAVADWEGDGRAEVILLSPDERQIGVTHLDAQGRLPFPTLIPTEGRPLAMAVGGLKSGAKPTLVVIADDNGQRSVLFRSADGRVVRQKLSREFKSNPAALAIHDADQDGLADLVLLTPYEPVKVLRQKPDGAFMELDVAPPGGPLEQPWLARADVDGDGKPELLLAQRNFLRAVVLEPEKSGTSRNPTNWNLRVREQINGAGSNARLVAAAPIPLGTNAAAFLALLDAERKALTLCQRNAAGVWEVARNLPLPVWDFTGLQTLPGTGTNLATLAFLGPGATARLRFEGDTWEFTEVDSYETPIKDGRLQDVVPGDLNGDGRKDLVFLETGKNYVDLVEVAPEQRLLPGNRWPVFEERTFRNRRSDFPEPREAVIADVTGDGRNDLLLLVHDRVLLYPQE
jgi:hypothetical protein